MLKNATSRMIALHDKAFSFILMTYHDDDECYFTRYDGYALATQQHRSHHHVAIFANFRDLDAIEQRSRNYDISL